MKIRTRLTLWFAFLTATILLVFASLIYISAYENREKEFYSLLKREALTKANLFFNAKVHAKTLQDIYRNNRQILNEVEVAIYDGSFNLLYHDAVDIDFVKETPKMMAEIQKTGEKQFYQEGWQVIGLRYEFENKSYVITATAIDQYGYTKLNSLLRSSIIVFVISIIFIYVAGRFFSKRAFEPVRKMVEKAKVISATNLDLRLYSRGSLDELSELANTFNEMLSRLESSFESQKNFVSNISHELRTPLAAIIAELELSTNKDRDTAGYKLTIQNALGDATKLVRLLNSLLDLAKASYDPSEISFKQIRIDEILLDARKQIQDSNPAYKIDIIYEQEIQNEHQILIKGNEYLLKVAFANLFENGCKFSANKKCDVFILFQRAKIKLLFKDQGIGISNVDLKEIFTPFYRGENQKFAEGNGIGLSLTQKIIVLHHGSIDIQSEKDKGTTVTVDFEPLK